jgi:hypothetical protein
MRTVLLVASLALGAWLGYHGVIAELLGLRFFPFLHGGFGALVGIAMVGQAWYWWRLLTD